MHSVVQMNLLSVHKAIEFIEEHLDEDISLSSVAAYVAFSEYHFHRIFSAVLGESVKEYIRKRRLSLAAQKLIGTKERIIDISAGCFFESHEAFTRAFKKMFGVSPSQYRRHGKEASFVEKRKTSPDMIQHLTKGITMEPKIVTKEGINVVGMAQSFGEDAFCDIKALWERFDQRQNEIENLAGDYALGVCAASMPSVKKAQGHTFVYMAARPVHSLARIPIGMIDFRLPDSRYAVFTHKGPLENLPHTVNYIWGTWLPSCPYQQADGPDFELYDSRFNCDTMDGEIDIYVPIL